MPLVRRKVKQALDCGALSGMVTRGPRPDWKHESERSDIIAATLLVRSDDGPPNLEPLTSTSSYFTDLDLYLHGHID